MLVISRCLQACGAGSAILTFAIIRDLYQGEQVAKLIAYMSAVVAISPIIAPIFGGYIQTLLTWQWNFLLLASVGIIIFLLSYRFLPETNQYRERSSSTLFRNTFLNYQRLLSDRAFIGNALGAAFSFGALFAYVSGAPYLLLNLMGCSPDLFGWLFASGAVGYVLGAFINGRLLSRMGLDYMGCFGIGSLISGGLIMLLTTYYYPHAIAAILWPQIFCEFGIAIVISIAVTKALQPIPEYAGAGSALIGFFRFIMATLSSCLVIVHHTTALLLACTILGFASCSLGCLKFSTYGKKLAIFQSEYN